MLSILLFNCFIHKPQLSYLSFLKFFSIGARDREQRKDLSGVVHAKNEIT